MQCQAASKVHYAVLGSFQHALLSFLHSIHRICIFLQIHLLKLYSIVAHLGHQTNNFLLFIY